MDETSALDTVFPCAHRYCSGCVKAMLKGNKKSVKCPKCRAVYRRDEILQGEVVGGKRKKGDKDGKGGDEEDQEEDEESGELDVSDVRGSWSTKVGWSVAMGGGVGGGTSGRLVSQCPVQG